LIGARSHDKNPSHEVVPGAAHVVAFEVVAAWFGRLQRDNKLLASAFRNRHVDVGALDPESMIGVVAREAQLNFLSGGDHDFRRVNLKRSAVT
jgi:hypothetical protein